MNKLKFSFNLYRTTRWKRSTRRARRTRYVYFNKNRHFIYPVGVALYYL